MFIIQLHAGIDINDSGMHDFRFDTNIYIAKINIEHHHGTEGTLVHRI